MENIVQLCCMESRCATLLENIVHYHVPVAEADVAHALVIKESVPVKAQVDVVA